MKKMQSIQCFHDPTLKNVDHKIIAWIIACVLIGVILSAVLPDFASGDIQYLRRQGRTQRLQLRPMRGRKDDLAKKAA